MAVVKLGQYLTPHIMKSFPAGIWKVKNVPDRLSNIHTKGVCGVSYKTDTDVRRGKNLLKTQGKFTRVVRIIEYYLLSSISRLLDTESVYRAIIFSRTGDYRRRF